MSANQELTALVKRLEAVATRLENAPGSAGAAGDLLRDAKILSSTRVGSMGLDALATAIARLEASSAKLAVGFDVNRGDASASMGAFLQLQSGPLKTFCDLSKKIGGDVAAQVAIVESGFSVLKDLLDLASKSKQPSPNDLPMILKPLADKIAEIQQYRESHRGSSYFNHLSAVSESIPALGWVAQSPAPSPFVKEMNDAGQFYSNRVLKEWKEKGKVHVEWTKAWAATLSELQAFVKEHHTTGLVWNAKGGVAKSSMGSGSSAGPPPPPPPPPPGLFDDVLSDVDAKKNVRNALFDDINRGEDVSKGLKKITDDMKTHKNPSLRGQGVIPASKPKAPAQSAVKTGAATARPPKFELEGKKWMIEYQKNNPSLVVGQTEVNQSVYIYKCEGSTVKVNGKVNNIVMDSCKKTAVVYDAVVSSCEFINCQSVQMQVMEFVPTIAVEKTDGCQIFLSKEAADKSEIITAKSSEANVVIPSRDDYVEQPIPEQFKTVVKGEKLVTTVSESV